jgi:plasmid stabilization system protein ParE
VKQYAVRLSARAQTDILDAIRWECNSSAKRGAEWEAVCEEALASLRTMPNRCPIVKELTLEEASVRRLIFGSKPAIYKIYFQISDDMVDVLYCRHASRIEPDFPV